MSLFDFEFASGKKIGMEMNLNQEVDELGIQIDDLEIDYSDGVVNVSGAVSSQSDREKIILALGNVNGIRQVIDTIDVMEVEAESESFFYTVQPGDSLSKIAKAQYGNAMEYMKIFEANRPMLSDPNKIYPGQMLRIPE
jgi:nucleoid-associated protein YgaU